MIYYDLKQEAKRKSIGDAIGREGEIRRIARTLKRQYNNNVIVRGESGVGKTAIIEAFFYRAAGTGTSGGAAGIGGAIGAKTSGAAKETGSATGETSADRAIPGFENYSFAKLDSANLKKLFAQINNAGIFNYLGAAFGKLPKNSIVFIDDFENVCPENRLYETGQALTPFFERSDLCLVLAMTEKGRQRMGAELPGFFRHFEEIAISESGQAESTEILKALAPAFELQYSVSLPGETAKFAVGLAAKIPSDKKFPLRAIHLLDESLAFAKISGLKKLGKAEVRQIANEAMSADETARAAAGGMENLQNLETELNKAVIGQERAAKTVANIVRKSGMGLRNPNRPNGSFLFLGPSGVGKTELSKVLAKNVFGSERAFARIDMSEFSEPHTVHRLIGAPPGYIGFEAGGQLTNAIARAPHSLILLDEIEKAHPKIFDIFLQVLEDGRLTDGQGKTADFTNSIIIATSNLGIEEIAGAHARGEDVSGGGFVRSTMMPILVKTFKLEFLNRFDAIIVFNPLGVPELFEIARMEIKKIEDRASETGLQFNINPEILRARIAALADYRFGARPVKRFVEETCEELLEIGSSNRT